MSVVARLGAAIEKDSQRLQFGGYAQGNTLKLIDSLDPGVFSGTETGLGIPKPPTALTVVYLPETRTFRVNWINGDDYDAILLNVNSNGCKRLPRGTTCSTLTTSSIWTWGNTDAATDVFLFGMKNGTSSPPAHVLANRWAQRENPAHHGACGMVPNWTMWSSDGSTEAVHATVRENRNHKRWGNNWSDTPETRPFFQSVATRRPDVKCGIMRRFVGLVPGHKIRLDMWVNSFGLESRKGSCRFYAAPLESGMAPSPSALANPQSWPGGADKVRELAVFEPGKGTGGNWKQISKLDPKSPVDSREMPLGDGLTDVLVWCVGESIADPGVGLDLLELVDLTGESRAAN